MVDQHEAWPAMTRSGKSHTFTIFGMLLVCLGLLVLQAGCQEGNSDGKATSMQTEPVDVTDKVRPVDQAQGDVPKISVEKNVLDFGEIGPGAVKTGKFTFKNVGKAPLKVLDVKSCCGVSTKGVKRGQIYKPGETGALEFNYTAGTRLGPVNRDLYLTTNDPNQERVKLSIKSKVVLRVKVEPTSLRLFTKLDNAGAKDIVLTSLDGKPFAVTGFRSTSNAIIADFDPSKEATEFVLKPKVDLEKLPRYRKGQVSIDLTHPMCTNLRINYDVLPEFALDTSQIIVFKAKPDELIERKIWVISNYEADFEIESVSTQKGIVNIINKEKVGNRYHLTLGIVPPSLEEGETVVIDELEIKIKGGETLMARIRLFYS